MNRKLLLLDVVLGIAVLYGGIQLHSHWSAAKARQAGMPGAPLQPAPPPPISPLPQQPAVLATGFREIADKDLFETTRNPNVPVDPPPPPAPPPEPPPLPSFHGMGNFGDGPVAMMAEAGETRTKEIHAGGMIGPFKLLAFDRQEFEVEWEGRRFKRRMGEATAAPPGAATNSAAKPLGTVPGVIPGVAAPQTTPVQPPPQAPQQNLGPGTQVSDTVKLCQAGDSTPVGTVTGGYQKITRLTPMGSSCSWVAIGR